MCDFDRRPLLTPEEAFERAWEGEALPTPCSISDIGSGT